jgi:L-alanine-DL-glutamate epimerase-like enolase superfamily enzyme
MTLITHTEIRHKKVPLRATFSTALRSISELDVIEYVINGSYFGQTIATPAITGDGHTRIIEDLSTFDLAGREISDLISFNEELQDSKLSQSSKAAIDMALYSAIHGTMPPIRVKSDVTIPFAPITDYPNLIEQRSDFDVFKIKLSKSALNESIEKILIVRESRPDVAIRIDPNQSWSVDETLMFTREIEVQGLEIDYLEQPTPRADFQALRHIRENCSIRVMADESCFTEKDLTSLIELNAIDFVNLKILKNGGITEVRRLAEMAKLAGIKVSIGSMMEGEIGIKAAAYLAATISQNDVHDLDAAWWHSQSSIVYDKGFMVTQ